MAAPQHVSPVTLAVTGVSMLSAVGYTAPQTCAAIRAGVAMFSELGGIVGRTGEAVVAARLPEGIRDDPMDKNIERICVAVCAEALAGLSEEELGSRPIKIWICLKDKARPGMVLSAQPFLQQLIDRLSLHRSTTMTVIEAGNAGGLKAIHEIALQANRAPKSLSLICGFDLLTDIHCLARLKGSYQPRGLIPGEACACLSVEPLAAAKDAGRNVFCNIQGTGYSEETATVVSEEPCLGSGLTTAIGSALQSAGWAGDAVDGVYCDLNGEPYRAYEWMLALCRTLSDPEVNHPADCIGDVGAAFGPLLIGFASTALWRGYAPGPRGLIFCSSDFGARAAACVTAV